MAGVVLALLNSFQNLIFSVFKPEFVLGGDEDACPETNFNKGKFICRRIKKARTEDKKCHIKTMMNRNPKS